jgi:thiol:disulfide interchange protein
VRPLRAPTVPPPLAAGCALTLALLLGLTGCVQVDGRGGVVAPHYAHPFVSVSPVVPAPVPTAYDPRADAAVAAALAQSRRDGRPVLVEFGAVWCADCQALAQRIADPAVKLLLQRDYRLVAVDIGHYDRNAALAARWIDLKRSGIPALVVLNPDGTVRATTQDGSFANARTLSSDDVAGRLVTWLYPSSRS